VPSDARFGFQEVARHHEITTGRKRPRPNYENENCCADYRAYFERQHRKGRPPHSPTCPIFNGKR
jgi:hypothetical protein